QAQGPHRRHRRSRGDGDLAALAPEANPALPELQIRQQLTASRDAWLQRWIALTFPLTDTQKTDGGSAAGTEARHVARPCRRRGGGGGKQEDRHSHLGAGAVSRHL